MKQIDSYHQFKKDLSALKKTALLLYKEGSKISDCAYQNLGKALEHSGAMPVFAANVNTTRDIHTQYGISSAPSLLLFEHGSLTNVIKGCQEPAVYKLLLEHAVFQSPNSVVLRPPKRVTVYSTPSCGWCNTLKAWLQNNQIQFTDIDVSHNQEAASEMVRRSGQQGVPQIDVNGQMVLGFDQQRLQDLLEIQ